MQTTQLLNSKQLINAQQRQSRQFYCLTYAWITFKLLHRKCHFLHNITGILCCCIPGIWNNYW